MNSSLSRNTKIKCGCVIDEPYVMYTNGVYKGILIDIWEKIATTNHLSYEYIYAGINYDEAIKNIEKYDIIIGAFTMTPKRFRLLLFVL